MTWYLQPRGDGLTHSGSLARGRVTTRCRIAFPAHTAVRVDLAAGGDQSQLICPECQAAQDAR